MCYIRLRLRSRRAKVQRPPVLLQPEAEAEEDAGVSFFTVSIAHARQGADGYGYGYGDELWVTPLWFSLDYLPEIGLGGSLSCFSGAGCDPNSRPARHVRYLHM